jgi:hypothetical protein
MDFFIYILLLLLCNDLIDIFLCYFIQLYKYKDITPNLLETFHDFVFSNMNVFWNNDVFWQVYTSSKFSDRFTQARSFLTGLHKLKVFWQVYTRSLDKFYIQTCSCYWPCNVTMFYSLLWSLNGKLCFFIFQYKYNNSIPFFLLLIDLVYFVVTGTSIESVVNCAFICFYISWI